MTAQVFIRLDLPLRFAALTSYQHAETVYTESHLTDYQRWRSAIAPGDRAPGEYAHAAERVSRLDTARAVAECKLE